MPPKPAKLSDVAHLAGVSGQTVSRVVNGGPNVSAATRQRVEAAIAQLDYNANHSARALATSRSYTICAISAWLSALYIGEIHNGAAQACSTLGYHLTIETLDPANPENLQAFARTLRRLKFDGVLLLPPLTEYAELLALLDREQIRYVRFQPAHAPGRSDAIFADDMAGMDMAVEHLWQMGHRRFAFCEGKSNTINRPVRRHGVLDAVARRGGDPAGVCIAAVDPGPIDLTCPDIPIGVTFEMGFRAAQEVFAMNPRPTAIIAYMAEMAAGAIACAHDQGIAVPGDISVIGFDNNATTLVTWPPLTTIDQHIAQMARIAVQWLVAPATDEKRSVTLPVELVIRSSTGPVKS